MHPAFLAYYTYGLSGSRFENVPGEFSGALDAESARRAWFAGQNDGEISLRQEQQRAGYATTAGKDSGLVYDDFVKEAVTGGRARADVNGEERVYLSAETAERVNQGWPRPWDFGFSLRTASGAGRQTPRSAATRS